MRGSKETGYSMFFSALSKVSMYVLLLVFANFFLKEVYGRAAFVMNVFHLVLFFSMVGLPYVLVPWIIRKRDVASVFSFLMGISIVCTIVGIFATWNYLWTMPIVFLFPLLFIRGFSAAYLQAQYRYHIDFFWNLMFNVFLIGFVVLFVDLGKAGIIWGYTLAYVLASFALIFITRKEIGALFSKLKLDFYHVKVYISKAIVTSLLYISFAFLGWIDSTILGWLSTFENVAIYNVAGPISNVITIVPISVGLFLLTKSSEVSDRIQSRRILSKVLRISFSFSFLAAVALASLSYWIISFFFPKYLGIEPFIIILLIGIVFYSLYHLVYSYLLGKLRPEKALLPIGLAAVLNIILDIILIPQFGLYGICYATLLSHLIAFTILAIKMKVIKQFAWVYGLVLFIPLAFYMKHYGLILLIVLIPLLGLTKLLKLGDIQLVVNVIRNMSKVGVRREMRPPI